MQHLFQFKALPKVPIDSIEANIFIHGYSAGHNDEDKQLLLERIPEELKHYTNIFAFWPSNHYLHFDKSSVWKLCTSGINTGLALTRSRWSLDSLDILGTLTKDRRNNFTQARARAERMGLILFDQLQNYLKEHHPQITTINLIGHSLGGRLVISSLKNFSSRQQLIINDVLLMAAAVEVSAAEALKMRAPIYGRLINAYSKSDRTLLLNWGETCLGRNDVEHFDNIEMNDFGHSDYWKRFPEVLIKSRFKKIIPPANDLIKSNLNENNLVKPLMEPVEKNLPQFQLKNPSDVYHQINDELSLIIAELEVSSEDEALERARVEVLQRLKEHRTALSERLAELERNAEWNKFTIAFYGETGAGKSTLIETLRILLQEPTKRASQQEFRKLREQYRVTEETLQELQQKTGQIEAIVDELTRQLNAVMQQFEKPFIEAQRALDQANVRSSQLTQQLCAELEQREQLHKEALETVTRLHTLLITRKSNASFWQKILNLFRQMPEEIELNNASASLTETIQARDGAAELLNIEQQKANQERLTLEQQLSVVTTERDAAREKLVTQQSKAIQNQQKLMQLRLENEAQLAELAAKMECHADGEIIGDGRADFTRETQRYDLELDGQPFALLDVPGIEGKEGLVLDQIEQAVQTAHAVFYVTNQPAPPQTGDGQHQGTLEKIKHHLGAQTEVWTIFNKKITSPKHSLGNNRALISEDESLSLAGLDEKMAEQLGKNYQEFFPLSALPAFLASTDYLAPGSQNAKRRSKVLEDFGADELLEKSRLQGFLQLLNNRLIRNSQSKIVRANLNKANDALNQTTTTLSHVHKTLSLLSKKLGQEETSAKSQLSNSFLALKNRLGACGETLIADFASRVRNNIYEQIDSDISNDTFKSTLAKELERQQEELSQQLPEVINAEVLKFRKAAEDIFLRFEKHAQELTASYAKLGSMRFNEDFSLNIEIDNGIKVIGLLASLVGIALVPFTGGASLWLLGASALTALVSIGKAIASAFSTDYKKSQQRQALDKNLRAVTDQLRETLQARLSTALNDMQSSIEQLELALEAPTRQAANQVETLNRSTRRLNNLSRQIEIAGNL